MECPKCRYVSLPGSHFCEKCGYDLKSLRRQQARPVPPARESQGYAPSRNSGEYGSYRPAPAPAPTPAPAPRPTQPSAPAPRAAQPAPMAPPPPPRPAPAAPPPRIPGEATRARNAAMQQQQASAAAAPAAPAAPAQPAPFAELEDLTSGRRIELRWDRSQVGRQSAADNLFPEVDLEGFDRDGTVSRRHALILRDGPSVVVEDTGSRNGTFVHQVKVEAGLQHELQDGDEIRFGTVRFRFRRR